MIDKIITHYPISHEKNKLFDIKAQDHFKTHLLNAIQYNSEGKPFSSISCLHKYFYSIPSLNLKMHLSPLSMAFVNYNHSHLDEALHSKNQKILLKLSKRVKKQEIRMQ